MRMRYKTKTYHAVLSTGRLALFRNGEKYNDLDGCKMIFKNNERSSVHVLSKDKYDNKFRLIVNDGITKPRTYQVRLQSNLYY